MSIFESVTLACPSCGEAVQFESCSSVNADRRPDLRDGIVDGSFQREPCGRCGTSFRLDPELVYLDMGRDQWIAVHPVDDLGDWQAREAEARETFARAYGEKASGAAKTLGDTLKPRMAFGWSAVREKLVAADEGLDDAALELVKIAIVRDVENVPLGDDTELRLVAVEGDDLIMAWIEAASENLVETMRVPRSLYDEINEDHDDWQPLREEVSAGMFVDMQRLMIGA